MTSLRRMSFLVLVPLGLLSLTGCLDEYFQPPEASRDITVEYAAFETLSLGPYPVHQAAEEEKFVVLDMLITNGHPWKAFRVHRMYFFLATEDQRFMAAAGASSMPDLRYPISNNSEILPGGSARQMTFFRIPKYMTEYSFEYDEGSLGNFQNNDISWTSVEVL